MQARAWEEDRMKAQEDHRTLWGEDHMQALAWEEDHTKAQEDHRTLSGEDHKMVQTSLEVGHKMALVS